MMKSVEPHSSAACTTSNVHSGWTMTLPAGCVLRNCSICLTVKRVWTLQWPFHRISRARCSASRLRPPNGRSGSHIDHLVERHAHPERGVAAEVLVGQHQQLLGPIPRPRHDASRALLDVQTMPPCSPQKALMAAVELMYVTGIDVGRRRSCRSSCQHISS